MKIGLEMSKTSAYKMKSTISLCVQIVILCAVSLIASGRAAEVTTETFSTKLLARTSATSVPTEAASANVPTSGERPASASTAEPASTKNNQSIAQPIRTSSSAESATVTESSSSAPASAAKTNTPAVSKEAPSSVADEKHEASTHFEQITPTPNILQENEPVIIDTGSIAFSGDGGGADDSVDGTATDNVSFGIRSFTIEVTTATEKPSTSRHEQKQRPDVSTLASDGGFRRQSSGIASTQNNRASGTASPLGAVTTTVPAATSSHEPASAKDDNGLYRIKIAEIITDEFNNGMRDDDESSLNNIQNEMPPNVLLSRYREKLEAAANPQHGKMNIADLYPSKIEDFNPIIRESNEKMIRDKNLLTGNDEERARLMIADDNNRQANTVLNGDGLPISVETNIPTTKIEIELIDEPDTSRDDVKIIGTSDDDVDEDVHISSIDASVIGPDGEIERVTDLTSRLQESDGIINDIERSFRKVDSADLFERAEQPSTSATIEPITINRPVIPRQFIPRRVKKHDPLMFKSQQRLDQLKPAPSTDNFASTKFDGDNSIADSANGNGNVNASESEARGPSELSTTKFYNSKELYNEMLHGEAQGVDDKSKAAGARPQDDNKMRTEGQGSDDLAKIETNVRNDTIERAENVSVVRNALGEKIVFLNLNGNNVTSGAERERLKHERQQIIKESAALTSNGTDASNQQQQPSQQPPQPPRRQSSNMHLFIIQGNSSQPVEATTNTSAAKVPLTSSRNNKTSAASAGRSASTLGTSTPAPSTPAAAPALQSQGAEHRLYLMRSQQLNHLRDRINLLDCDMQTTMPDDATVWRGNETHELSLPTTVS